MPQACYLKLLKNKTVHKTIEYSDEIYIDIDEKGEVIGIEVLLNPENDLELRVDGEKKYPE